MPGMVQMVVPLGGDWPVAEAIGVQCTWFVPAWKPPLKELGSLCGEV